MVFRLYESKLLRSLLLLTMYSDLQLIEIIILHKIKLIIKPPL